MTNLLVYLTSHSIYGISIPQHLGFQVHLYLKPHMLSRIPRRKEGTGTQPDYLANRAHTQIEGPTPGKKIGPTGRNFEK